MASQSLVFTPALGEIIVVPAGSSTASIYALSSQAVRLVAIAGNVRINFEEVKLPTSGGLFTYRASLARDVWSSPISIEADSAGPLGSVTIRETDVKATQEDQSYFTDIVLEEGEEFKSAKLDWLDHEAWEGWAWYRPHTTWIEVSFVSPLKSLSPVTATHALLLRPSNTTSTDPEQMLAVFPASTKDAFVTLRFAEGNESPGVYARVRRVNRSGTLKVSVAGYLASKSGTSTAFPGAVDIARTKYGISSSSFTDLNSESDETPFDGLGFCTWSSIGEGVPLTRDNVEHLLKCLQTDDIPVKTFLIDDGWQDIRHGHNGAENSRGLWSFGTWEGMGCDLSYIVGSIKKSLPTVRDVGVWMTMYGYWNSIVPGSPLAQKYDARMFPLNRDHIPGLYYPPTGFDGQQSSTIADPALRQYCLPPPEKAYAFWKDYFAVCKDAGCTFVKVDNQASGLHLAGVAGGEEFVALWDGMLRAADETFGYGRVIHCMAHSERTFNGDVGMGVATKGRKVVIRASDDFGLPRPDVHRNHVLYNMYNALLMKPLCLIPDADMFMTGAQWPEYHAVVRAFMPGPMFLADKPGMGDRQILDRLTAYSKSKTCEVVRSRETLKPLARNMWERFLDAGCGPALKGTAFFPESQSAAVIIWSSRESASQPSYDLIFEGDLVEALGGGQNTVKDVVVWSRSTNTVVCTTLDGTKAFRACEYFSSNPILSVSVKPEEVEILSVVPFAVLDPETKIACLGLIDKYAGLAAVKSIRTQDGRFTAEVQYAGLLGFIVEDASVPPKHVQATVDGVACDSSIEDMGPGLTLLTMNISAPSVMSASNTWTVEIQL